MSGLARLDRDERAQLVRAYRALVVPGRQPLSYHVMVHGKGWIHAKWPGGDARVLDDYAIERHLRGNILVAARWPADARVRLAVFDVDTARPRPGSWHRPALPPIRERIDALKRALAPARLQALRSSRSGGLHLYLFLDRAYPAREVREVLLARLRLDGVRLRPGCIEMWPDNKALRLPLGRGSHLLTSNLNPAAVHPRGKQLVRDVAAAVARLKAFASRHSVTLDSLRLSSISSSGVDHCSSKEVHGSSSTSTTTASTKTIAPHSPRSDFWDDVDASHGGVSEPGLRYQQASRRLFLLRVVRGLPRDEALVEYEHWLTTGDHDSKDLCGPRRDSVIASMMRDARSYLDRLDANLLSGDLVSGVARGPGRSVALSRLLDEARREHGQNWRDVARSMLCAADLDVISGMRDGWLRSAVEVAWGLLRMAGDHLGASRFTMTLAARSLMTIAGGRSRPPPQDVGPIRRKRSPHRQLRDALECLHLIAQIHRAEPGRHANVFTVTLPQSGAKPA